MYKKNEIDIKVTVNRINNSRDFGSKEFIFVYEVCIINNTALKWDLLDIRSKIKYLFGPSSKSKSINNLNNESTIKPYANYIFRRTVALKDVLGKVHIEAVVTNNIYGCKVLCAEKSLVALSVVN
ncbi:MAG: hypothetical protein ACQPRJ_03625 [Solitalea-like symbiont of Acarus siro]